MLGGRFLSIIFMLGWTLVALLSIVCTLDAIIAGLAGLTADRFGRGRWAWVVTIAIAVIMFPIAMNPESIGVLDLIFGSGMFMLGGLLAVLALGWGLGKSVIREQLGQHLSPRMATWLSWWLRFAVPLVLFIILAAYLVSLINP
jgi:NSS family neurotransmitter:Na+ symporter